MKLPIDQIKPNPNNPRNITPEQLERLKQSILDFPEMLEKRPLVVDEDYIVLGGNQRLQAAKAAGITELTVIVAEGWTQEQKDEFIVKDNVSFGTWDFKGASWENSKLIRWGLDPDPSTLEKKEISDQEFNQEFEKYNDDNAAMPIVPEFHEKYTYFVILTTNEIDAEFIRNQFELTGKHTSHKDTDNRKSNIIPFEKVQEICLK